MFAFVTSISRGLIVCAGRSGDLPAGFHTFRLSKTRLAGRAPQILRKTVRFLSDRAADCQRVASLFGFCLSPVSLGELPERIARQSRWSQPLVKKNIRFAVGESP